MQPTTITVNGRVVDPGMMPAQSLERAVIISIFAWRRAEPDDRLPGSEKNGWWGDTWPDIENDRIGSRFWLLTRDTITPKTLARAKEYVEEALQWLVDDLVADSITVSVQRQGIDTIVISTVITKPDKTTTDIRMVTAWTGLS
ncbi:phage GP46 family protein [Oxalobacter paraformigenes]|nr:phage GP46 family protein [Oxalobacter paraformigenes]